MGLLELVARAGVARGGRDHCVAIVRLPGIWGPSAGRGVKAGAPTKPIELSGVVLAGLVSVGLGLVLGPEEGWCSVRRLR